MHLINHCVVTDCNELRPVARDSVLASCCVCGFTIFSFSPPSLSSLGHLSLPPTLGLATPLFPTLHESYRYLGNLSGHFQTTGEGLIAAL